MEVTVFIEKSKLVEWETSVEDMEEAITDALRCFDLPDLSTLYLQELRVQVEVTE